MSVRGAADRRPQRDDRPSMRVVGAIGDDEAVESSNGVRGAGRRVGWPDVLDRLQAR